jgi:peptidoglycan hydrolase CwlO-like protein
VRRPASSHPETGDGRPAPPEDRFEPVEEPPREEDSLTDALDAVGRRSEAIRGRISNLHERLEDLTTLKDEFVAFVGPLADLITEFPEVQSKLHDAETMLTQLRETNATLARDLQTVRTHNVKLTDEVTALSSTNQDLFARIDDMDASIDGLRQAFSDKEGLASDLEKRLFAETDTAARCRTRTRPCAARPRKADQTGRAGSSARSPKRASRSSCSSTTPPRCRATWPSRRSASPGSTRPIGPWPSSSRGFARPMRSSKRSSPPSRATGPS